MPAVTAMTGGEVGGSGDGVDGVGLKDYSGGGDEEGAGRKEQSGGIGCGFHVHFLSIEGR